MGFSLLARLLYRGRLLDEVRVSPHRGLRVGEQGDLVVPSIAAHSLLAIGDQRCVVPGLSGGEDGPQPVDEVTTLTLEAHPEVTIELQRIAASNNPFRRGLLRAPVRELAYGLGLALGIASFVTVKVAVSPAPPEDSDDQSEIVRAMLAAPVATYELPPIPVVAAAPIQDPSPNVGGAQGERGSGVESNVEPEADEPLPMLAQIEPDAEPEPVKPPAKKKRRRKRGKNKKKKSEGEMLVESVAVARVLGTYGGDGGTVFDVIESQEGSLGELFVSGATNTLDVKVAEPEPPTLDNTAGIGVGVAAEPPSNRLPTVGLPQSVPGKGDDSDGRDPITKPACDAKTDPKSQVDVVFVVDASGDMGEALASLSAQVSSLDAEISQYDRAPHYGLVAFVDELDVRTGGQPLSGVGGLEKELDRLLLRAGTNRQPDGTAANDEVANNGLDALHAAATAFDWRDEADTLRLVVYASASPLGARGAVLSGRKVRHGYAAVATTLADASIRVASFTGAAAKAGFRGKRSGRASIPDQTAGSAFSLDGLVSGRVGLRGSLEKLLTNPVCERGLFD